MFEHDHAYIFQNPDKRIIFAIPYEGEFTLIGTTDVEHRGEIGAAAGRRRRGCAYLCEQASRYFAAAGAAGRRCVELLRRAPAARRRDPATLGRHARLLARARHRRRPLLLNVWGGRSRPSASSRERRPTCWPARCERARRLDRGVHCLAATSAPRIGAHAAADTDFSRFVRALALARRICATPLVRRLARAYGCAALSRC